MNVFEQFQNVKTFIFDVDGVFTDNNLLVTEEGELLRVMNARDGYAVKCAVSEGYRICVITGGRSRGVTLRLKKLGINDVFSGVLDKMEVYENYIALHGLDEAEILYMGDDIMDYRVMRRVGLATCPVDSVPEVLSVARYVSPLKGGAGCVRDVIEKVLKLHGKWATDI